MFNEPTPGAPSSRAGSIAEACSLAYDREKLTPREAQLVDALLLVTFTGHSAAAVQSGRRREEAEAWAAETTAKLLGAALPDLGLRAVPR